MTSLLPKGLTKWRCGQAVGVAMLLATPVPAAVITTSDGAGADAFIQNGSIAGDTSNDNFGASSQLNVKNSVSATALDRKSYMRFDLSSLAAPIDTASLELTTAAVLEQSTFPWTIRVWGLDDGHTGETWSESGITWNNAPANTASGADLSSDAQLLGTFTVVGEGTAGQLHEFSSPNLTSFLNADTNDLATLILTRVENENQGDGGAVQRFASKENSSFAPPTLNVTLVPEPASIGLLAIASLTLLRRRQRG